jgi:hypothetical protein
MIVTATKIDSSHESGQNSITRAIIYKNLYEYMTRCESAFFLLSVRLLQSAASAIITRVIKCQFTPSCEGLK